MLVCNRYMIFPLLSLIYRKAAAVTGRRFPQLVEKPCLKEKSPFLQGEYEGAGAPSCWIECLQKACVSRRLRRAAAAFRPDARAEKRGIVKPVKKVRTRTFSTG